MEVKMIYYVDSVNGDDGSRGNHGICDSQKL